MRRTAILVLLLLAALLSMGLTTSPGVAQSGAVETNRDAQDPRRDWDPISFRGRAEFEISDPDKVPRQIAKVARCDYTTHIKDTPIRFFEINRQRFVLVFCSSIVGSHIAFDLRSLEPIAFPFLALDKGFGTTRTPGFLASKNDAGVFEFVSSTDICPRSILRHSYEVGSLSGLHNAEIGPFVLKRVEVMEDKDCTQQSPWIPVWESPRWSPSTVVR